MQKFTITAEKRKILGRKVKQLRSEKLLPANIYGKKVKSEAVQVKLEDFEKVYENAGETGVIELKLGKEKRPVLIHNLQVNPVTGSYIHADFFQVDLKQKVSAEIPVELIGESSVEKQNLGTIVQYVNEIEVEALPNDLPDKFLVDASKINEVDQAVLAKDLSFDKNKINLQIEPETIIVKAEPPQKEEEVTPPATEEVVEEAVPGGEKEGEANEEAPEKAEKEEAGE